VHTNGGRGCSPFLRRHPSRGVPQGFFLCQLFSLPACWRRAMFWREKDPRTFEWFCLGLSSIEGKMAARVRPLAALLSNGVRAFSAASSRAPSGDIFCPTCTVQAVSSTPTVRILLLLRSQCGAAGGPSNILDQFDAAAAGNGNGCIGVLLD